MQFLSSQRKAGAIFIAIGLFFLFTGLSTLEFGTALRMGPGFLPSLLAALLVVLGFAVMVERAPPGGGEAPTIPWRGLFFITLAPLLFALLIKIWGLAPALLALIVTAALASRRIRLPQIILITAVLLAVALLLFSYVLKLPYPLFTFSPW